MGRPAVVTEPEILAAARQAAWERGCSGVTATDVALRAGCPSGSIYHRYAGRDELLAELWLEAVEHFQTGYVAAMSQHQTAQAAGAAARHVLIWSREEPQRAHVLLWFRRSDLLSGSWPASVVARAEATGRRLEDALAELTGRLGCTPRRVTMAVVDLPYSVARRRLRDGGATEEDEALVAEVVATLVARSRTGKRTSRRRT